MTRRSSLLALLGFLLACLFGRGRIGLHNALAEDRQCVGHLADLVTAAPAIDFGGKIAAGKPRHGLLQTDQPRHQIAPDIEPDEQGGTRHG